MTATNYIDCDLSDVPHGQSTGLLDTPAEWELCGDVLETFSALRPQMMIPRSRWKDIARERMATKQRRDDVQQIYSQGQIGSCTGMATAMCIETMRRRRYGKSHWVSLSGLWLYQQIPGVTRNSGAYIKDAMELGCKYGVLPASTPANRAAFPATHPYATWQTPPANGRAIAKQFRGHRFCVARGIDEVFSAVANDCAGIVGRQSHCVPYLDVAWDDKADQPLMAFGNSWSLDWGDAGWGYDSIRITRDITCLVLLDVVVPDGLGLPELD